MEESLPEPACSQIIMWAKRNLKAGFLTDVNQHSSTGFNKARQLTADEHSPTRYYFLEFSKPGVIWGITLISIMYSPLTRCSLLLRHEAWTVWTLTVTRESSLNIFPPSLNLSSFLYLMQQRCCHKVSIQYVKSCLQHDGVLAPYSASLPVSSN